MGLSRAQHGLYRRLYLAAVAARPALATDEARLAMHAELGLPESRADWTNDDFDEWKRACLAITEPANLDAQVDGLRGKEERRLFRIRELLSQLGKTDRYAETTASNMGITKPLATMSPAQLEKVIVALDKQAGREAKRAALAEPAVPADNIPF